MSESVPEEEDEEESAASASAETATEAPEPTREELLTELEILHEQHDHLRRSYVRGRQTRYTRTAVGFAAVGLAAAAAALLFPAAATVLFALAGVGLFGALLVAFLTPETFIATDVGRSVYDQLARTEAALVDELALASEARYVPPSRADGAVRLFVPEAESTVLPTGAALSSVFVLGEDGDARGVAFHPTGAPLVEDFERAVAGGVADDPERLAAQLCDALVEQFELVDRATPDVDPADGRLTVAVAGSAYGPLDRLNHPVTSFVATGIARALDATVTVAVEPSPDGDADLLTCRWESPNGGEARDRAGGASSDGAEEGAASDRVSERV